MPRGERPLDPGDTPLLRFAADLRKLREKAGNPVYRELSRRAHYSAPSLSDAAGGRKLPTLAVTLAYVAACDGDTAAWEQRWREVAAELAYDATPETSGRPPYLGLSAFQIEDADRFFGRDDLVAELLEQVRNRRFVGVFGASGAGKSSLLRAGLVAAAEYRALVFTPGAHPLEEAAVQVGGLTGVSTVTLRAEFADDPTALHLRVRETLPDEDLLLVVDQFEELFTLCADEAERQAFVAALVHAATVETSRTRVVIGVRADFLGHCTQLLDLREALRGGQVLVGPMTADELRVAITKPAAGLGQGVEAALVTRLIADAVGQPGVLPLVSHALLETWRRRQGVTLTLAGYDAAGGIRHAIAQTAEAVYAGFDAAQQDRARQLFVRLTALGDGTPDTRRRVSRAELDADETMDAVLDALTDARLITVDRDGVEVTHEALISHWPRLRDWLAADREGLRTHRQLTDATEAWAAVDEDPGALYRGTRLELARDWVDRADPVLTERERRFYDASVAARTREETAGRRRTTRLRLVVALLAVLVLAATAGIVRSVAAEHDADQQRDIAVAQDAARQAATLRGSNPALSLQLSLAAYRLANVPVTRDGLLSSFAQPYSTRVDAGPDVSFQAAVSPKRHLMALSSRVGASIWDIADPHRPRQVFFVPGHTQTLLALAFNPEGTLLASVSTDRSTKLWDVTDPAHIRLDATMEGHAGVVDAVAFAPDGRTLLTGSYDGTARLWDVTEPAQPRPAGTIPAPGGALAVGFAPSGDFIAVAGAGVRLWDPHDLSAPLGVVDDNSAALAFTPDSRRLAVAAPGNQIMLLDVGNPRQPRTESTTPGPDSGVSSLAVSADGTLLAAGSGDHNVRLWDISDAAHPVTRATLPDYDSAVPAVAFTPDGSALVALTQDHIAMITDVAPLLTQAQPNVVTAGFGPGNTVVTADKSGVATVRDLGTGKALGSVPGNAPPNAVPGGIAISGDGRLLAVNHDNVVSLWDISDPRRPRELPPLPSPQCIVYALVFSPDHRRLGCIGQAGVRIWDIHDPAHAVAAPLIYVAGPGLSTIHRATGLAFSPDNRLAVLARGDGSLRLWDIADAAQPRELSSMTGHRDLTLGVAFSPDGKVIGSASVDATVRLWDVADPTRPRAAAVLTDQHDTGGAIAFTPSGHILATGGDDSAVRLWDVEDPDHPVSVGVLTGHSGGIAKLAIAPDGHSLITAGGDHTVRLWDTDPSRVAARVCATAWPPITREQWNQYLPGIDFSPPCG